VVPAKGLAGIKGGSMSQDAVPLATQECDSHTLPHTMTPGRETPLVPWVYGRPGWPVWMTGLWANALGRRGSGRGAAPWGAAPTGVPPPDAYHTSMIS